MLNFGYTFYDKFGNFNNKKLLNLLGKAKKASGGVNGNRGKKLDMEITLFNSVRKKELWGFVNKFSIFVNSGIDVKAALGILIKQIKNPYLKDIIIEMRENIDHGVSIHETMERYPKVFDQLVVALIFVGEKTGQLGKILAELDNTLLENIELRGKVKGAMIYPAILIMLTLGVTIFMMVWIIPKITEAFEQTGVALPALTQMVVKISNFMINDYPIMIGVVIGVILLYRFIDWTYTGKMMLAIIKTKLPISGYIVKQSNIVYFIRSFTILLDSGVLLLESLKTSSQVVPNLAYKRELIRVKNEVELGLTISKSIGLNSGYEESVYLNDLIPEDLAYVINTGEETGTLSTSLKKVGENYNSELKRYIGNLSSMVEPLIIVIIGAIVGTIVLAVMSPFFEIGKVAQQL